jgi:anaerobic selenocysteine-containing dehydrogenase
MPDSPGAIQVIKTSCSRMDHGGCGLQVEIENGQIRKVRGDPASPISLGYICPKGLASVERTRHPDRLKHPLIRQGARGQGSWREASWDEALTLVAGRLNQIKKDFGPEAVVFAQGAPKGLEHFVLIRLANVFGSPNVCGPQNVCHMPRELAGLLTCGFFPVPDYESPTSLVLNWGSNLLKTNEEGIISLQLLGAIRGGADLIVIDPRRTHLADLAQSHLQLRPGSDGALAMGLIRVIIEEGLFDSDFVEQWTVGFTELREQARPYTLERVAGLTWLTPDEILQAAWTYATSRPAVIQWGNALEHTANGFQTCRALLCLMALTGNLEVPGGNVMPSMPPVARLADFVKASLLPNKVAKMLSRARGLAPNFMVVPPPLVLQAILAGQPYPVKAMFAQVTNPLLTYSDSRQTFEALSRLDFLAVSEIFMTPTAALADVVFPASTGFEFDDIGHYGLAHGWIAARPQIVDPPGQAWPDIKILSELGRTLGLGEHFWDDYRQALEEVLAPSGLSYGQFKEAGLLKGEKGFQRYQTAGFKTPSKKVELVATQLKKWGFDPCPAFGDLPEVSYDYPLLATVSKNPFYFHSAYRQLKSLRSRYPDPRVEMHPETARIIGVSEGDWVRIATPKGDIRQRVRISGRLDPRVVYLDYGWWFPEEDPASLFGWDRANVNVLTGNDRLGREMGTPNLRGFPCRIEKIR